MILSGITFFLAGLAACVKGADWLTDGASAVAARFGISSLVIGLTIVAFGTSAPELIVSIMAALRGHTEMAIGNVMGSNIFNTLAITGVTALIAPVACSPGNLRYDIPLSVLASVVLVAMTSKGMILTSDGIVLLCFFAVFLAYSFAIAHKNPSAPPPATTAGEAETDDAPQPLLRSLLLVLLGLTGLVLGGDSMVKGATQLALLLGVSESTIALTIVAAGTSAPELITSIVAARKGDTDMAMGNVVGSNIFNIFLILGVSAAIRPLAPGGIGTTDCAFLLGSGLLLWLFCRFGRRHRCITRPEGAILLTAAVAYYAWLVIQQ